MELEHVGIAVRDLEAAVSVIAALLGERPYKTEDVAAEGVRTHFIRAGGAKLELLEALDEASALARHIERRGYGLHHIAFEVDDLEEARDRLAESRFTILGEPRPGADGKRIFFVHPRDTAGVLFEFCRQARPALSKETISVDGRRIEVRRAGMTGPVALIHSDVGLPIESLARRLEQSTRVFVTANLPILLTRFKDERVHLIASARQLDVTALDAARTASLTVIVEGPIDAPSMPGSVLIAARPTSASDAATLYAGWSGADLAVGNDDLLIAAIEQHVRRQSAE